MTLRSAPLAGPERGQLRLALERFLDHRLAVASVGVLAFLALAAAAAPLLSPYDPERTNLLRIFEPPSIAHPMGTDSLGRDLGTRILYGGRVSLTIGVLVVTLAISIGVLVGGNAGYYGRAADAILMRLVDMMYLPAPVPAHPLRVLSASSSGGGGPRRALLVTTARLVWRPSSGSTASTWRAAHCVGARDRGSCSAHPAEQHGRSSSPPLGVASAILAEHALVPRPRGPAAHADLGLMLKDADGHDCRALDRGLRASRSSPRLTPSATASATRSTRATTADAER